MKRLIIPAIDLIDKKVVRLFQGRYEHKKEYDLDPVEIAKQFEKAGAERIHIVDLDGARAGHPKNLDVIESIRHSINIEIEVGGGIRDLETLRAYRAIGIDYMIISSAAFEQAFLEQAINLYGENLIVSLDVKNGIPMVQGWLTPLNKTLPETLFYLKTHNVKNIIYTEIEFDGTLKKRSFFSLQNYFDYFKNFNIIISGGVSDEETIKEAFSFSNVVGVIIGKALYEGKLDLTEIIKKYQSIGYVS